MSEENKAGVRRYFEEFHNGREHGILEDIMLPDLLEPTRRATEMLFTAFPDYRLAVESSSPRVTRSQPSGPGVEPIRENGRARRAPSRRRAER
jgi:hypothetical protein